MGHDTLGSKTESAGIERETRADAVTIDDTAAGAGSTEIDYRAAAGGAIVIPSGSLITAITWWVSATEGGTYVAAYESDGTTAVSQTVSAAGAFPIPDALYGASFIKPVATFSSGSVAESITVCLKS